MANNKKSLKNILEEFDKIIIPDVQRDYVMGSGGEKFEKLLLAMIYAAKNRKEFFFSCLVGYIDVENKSLYIYDGQQRLATLVYLCAYQNGNPDSEEMNILRKFSFVGRDVANSWLFSPKETIHQHKAVDFTTYSLAKLIEAFNMPIKYTNVKSCEMLTFDFLFNNVLFDLILVDEISDAEQFFLDINDGLDLKEYELFKAELFHHSKRILGEHFKNFALKIENKWLDFFHVIYKKSSQVCENEEEMLVFFIRYIFRMIWIEEKGSDKGYESYSIEWLTKEHLERLEQILDCLVANVSHEEAQKEISCVKYSAFNCCGAHWNLTDNDYIGMLKTMLRNIDKTSEVNKDVIMWCYLSNLPGANGNSNLYAYLRLIKKLLNNNRRERNTAKICYSKNIMDRNITYVKYEVIGIPTYYISYTNYDKAHNSEYSNAIIVSNKRFKLCDDFSEMVFSIDNKNLENLFKREVLKEKSEDMILIQKYEDLPFINGLVDNFLVFNETSCRLKPTCNNDYYKELKSLDCSSWGQYRAILNFIQKYRIELANVLCYNITVSWLKYTDRPDNAIGALIYHTWCDLFTGKSTNTHNNVSECVSTIQYINVLPDGWFSGNKLYQPKINQEYKGFAGYGYTQELWDESR